MKRLFLLVIASCSSTQAQRGPPVEYPGELRPPSDFGADFMMRQKIEAKFNQGQELAFEAVLQKQGDKLTLLGLTPFGSRAFLLEQVGKTVSFQNYVNRELPFPPRYILLDIQRTIYLEAVRDEGTHQVETAEEVMTETWQGGRLMERRVRRKSGEPQGELIIQYRGGMIPGEPPEWIHFVSGWFGYELKIQTTESRALGSTNSGA